MKLAFGCTILLFSTVSAFATLHANNVFCLTTAQTERANNRYYRFVKRRSLLSSSSIISGYSSVISSLKGIDDSNKFELPENPLLFEPNNVDNDLSFNNGKHVVLREGLRGGSQNVKKFIPKLGAINSKYNLIWSTGSIRNMLLSNALLFSTYLYITSKMKMKNLVFDSRVIEQMIPPYIMILLSVSTKFILPLFASACCMIQLLMNLLAVGGCAGFNTILGPIRPIFISILMFLTVIRFSYIPIYIHIIRWSITLMPEMVHIYNNWKQEQQSKQQHHNILSNTITTLVSDENKDNIILKDSSSTELSNDSFTDANDNHHIVTTKFQIPSMGCVACINKIDSVIRTIIPPNQLLQSLTSLNDENDVKGGDSMIQFVVNSKDDIDYTNQLILNAINDAGFGKETTISTTIESLNQLKQS